MAIVYWPLMADLLHLLPMMSLEAEVGINLKADARISNLAAKGEAEATILVSRPDVEVLTSLINSPRWEDRHLL